MDFIKYTTAQAESQEDSSFPVDGVNIANTRPKTNGKRMNNAIIINHSRNGALELSEINSRGLKLVLRACNPKI